MPGSDLVYRRQVPPMDLRGNRGYPELLYSITDNPFLWRNGRLTDTVDFVDVLTENVEVVFVFFTPTFGITSVVSSDPDIHLRLCLFFFDVRD